MKVYGMVLAALAVLILGAKVLQAGWTGGSSPKADSTEQKATTPETEREMMLRWQQHHPNHWRGYMLQQP
jgi:hypothetical protein